MLGEEDGFQEHAAAERFLQQVVALERDESTAEACLACKGASKLLDARVGPAGD
ncbi:MAG: hypothetical protein NVSMB3_06350 [Acidobacteriaceae bacterium]